MKYGGAGFKLMNSLINGLQADLFLAFVRIASPALDDLLGVVTEGVYIEPRAAGTRATDEDYSVVWLPGVNRETALHHLKLTTHGLSLVRMKSRFGIRVIATYEEAAHRELRPGEVFVKLQSLAFTVCIPCHMDFNSAASEGMEVAGRRPNIFSQPVDLLKAAPPTM